MYANFTTWIRSITVSRLDQYRLTDRRADRRIRCRSKDRAVQSVARVKSQVVYVLATGVT